MNDNHNNIDSPLGLNLEDFKKKKPSNGNQSNSKEKPPPEQ